MITTQQVRDAPGTSQAKFGKWRREFVKRAQLSRTVAGHELKVFAPNQKRPCMIVWEVRWVLANFVLNGGHGACETWEEAMAKAEAFVRSELTEGLEEL